MRISRRHRGFTIPELLIAIGILGIFGLAATRLFQSTIRISHATAQQQDAAGSFDAAVGALRGDAWIAADIACPDPNIAKVGKVTWTIDGTALTRDASESAGPRRWNVPQGMSFRADETSLVVNVPSGRGERGGEVRLVSQVKVLSKLMP